MFGEDSKSIDECFENYKVLVGFGKTLKWYQIPTKWYLWKCRVCIAEKALYFYRMNRSKMTLSEATEVLNKIEEMV